jgi:hypothetical protein
MPKVSCRPVNLKHKATRKCKIRQCKTRPELTVNFAWLLSKSYLHFVSKRMYVCSLECAKQTSVKRLDVNECCVQNLKSSCSVFHNFLFWRHALM